MKLLSFLSLIASAGAFSLAPSAKSSLALQASLPKSYPQEFDRAVECSKTFGECDVEELEKLADDLLDFQGCYFEDSHNDWLCDKEQDDRKDVADVLRLQAELQLRMDYLENANLFKGDVDDAHLAKERDDLIRDMAKWGSD